MTTPALSLLHLSHDKLSHDHAHPLNVTIVTWQTVTWPRSPTQCYNCHMTNCHMTTLAHSLLHLSHDKLSHDHARPLTVTIVTWPIVTWPIITWPCPPTHCYNCDMTNYHMTMPTHSLLQLWHDQLSHDHAHPLTVTIVTWQIVTWPRPPTHCYNCDMTHCHMTTPTHSLLQLWHEKLSHDHAHPLTVTIVTWQIVTWPCPPTHLLMFTAIGWCGTMGSGIPNMRGVSLVILLMYSLWSSIWKSSWVKCNTITMSYLFVTIDNVWHLTHVMTTYIYVRNMPNRLSNI